MDSCVSRDKNHVEKQVRLLSVILCLICAFSLSAQYRIVERDGIAGSRYRSQVSKPAAPEVLVFKVNFIGGKVLPLSTNADLIAGNPVLGGEFCVELPSWGAYPWQQYWGHPTLGVGAVALDFGNSKVMGQAFALYPYFLIHIVDRPHFALNYKAGFGVSFFTKNFYRCDTVPAHFGDAGTNTLIGSVVNFYITTGFDFSFYIKKGFSINFDLGYTHAGNGSVIQPNYGINMLYASVGANYLMEKCVSCRKSKPRRSFDGLPYEWSVDMAAAAGVRQLYYRDRTFHPIASLHVGATYNVCDWYAVGGGFDVFYDGVFNRQGVTPDMTQARREEQTANTRFMRYLITDDRAVNKFKVGMSVNNRFMIGRVTVLLDWGFYLFDPLRNSYVTEHPKYGRKRPFFYSYNIENEDGWNYFRLGARCRVWDNVFVQVSVKTHLHKAEMIEWGVGYLIPWSKKSNPGSLSATRDGYEIYHY